MAKQISLFSRGSSKNEWVAEKSAPPRTLASGVVQSLRSAIIYGEMLPGSRLNILTLSERFEVSPGVIREALCRLVSEGLVQSLDQRGFRAAPVSPTDLMEITRVRIAIESEALRQAITKGDTEWEGSVLAAYHALSKTAYFEDNSSGTEKNEWTARHRVFHRTVVAACESEWLLRFHDLLFDQTERYRRLHKRYLSSQSASERRDVYKEHQLIMEAVLARDADLAVSIMEEHFTGTAQRVIRGQEIDGPEI